MNILTLMVPFVERLLQAEKTLYDHPAQTKQLAIVIRKKAEYTVIAKKMDILRYFSTSHFIIM